MSENAELSDNELIALFMGFKKAEVHNLHGVCYAHPDLMGVYGEKAQKFLYDKSWDWLHPVLEKIVSRETFKEVECADIVEKLQHFEEVDNWPIASNLKDVHKGVVTFVRWYNQNKPQ